MNRLLFALALAVLLIAGASEAVSAQPAEPMIELPGHVSPALGNLEPSVPAPLDKPLQMEIIFLFPPAAEQFLADQQDPASPDYRRALTAQEIVDRFGPSESDFEALANWLTQQGFQIVSASRLDRIIKFAGSVAQAEQAFGVTIATSRDGRYFSNVNNPHIPARFKGLFGWILGLDNLGAVIPGTPGTNRPASRIPAPKPSSLLNRGLPSIQLTQATVQPDFAGGGLGQHFGPSDLRTFYSLWPLLSAAINGTGGDCLALVEVSNYSSDAVNLFNTTFSLPSITSRKLARAVATGDRASTGC